DVSDSAPCRRTAPHRRHRACDKRPAVRSDCARRLWDQRGAAVQDCSCLILESHARRWFTDPLSHGSPARRRPATPTAALLQLIDHVVANRQMSEFDVVLDAELLVETIAIRADRLRAQAENVRDILTLVPLSDHHHYL